jgi:hypothetical protein
MRAACLTFVLALGAVGVSAQAPALPETIAGRVLGEFLEAFNSGDRERIQEFVERYGWPRPVDEMVSFRADTGGFDLVSVEPGTPESIEFVVKERRSDIRAVGRLALADDPPRVKDVTLRAMPPGATVLGFDIDAATRDRVIDGAIAKLREFYVYEETAAAMATALERRRRAGEYDAITSGSEFAELLTTHLREVSHDRHLRVGFSPIATPPPTGVAEPTPENRENHRRRMLRLNCGFEKVEVLAGNVGYLKFNMFADPAVCGSTATAAMNFLQHVEALIIDVRDNGGGAPAMVAYVTTYLFDEPTHLNDLYDRAEDTTRQWWTLPHVPGARLADQPVYVLTSRRTFSGAEEFSYNLKNLGRATLVGEVTGGGAHPVRGEWIDERFTIGVPFARAINPVTKTNWEGTGVEPDVAVPAAEALTRALELSAAARAPEHR